MKYLNENFLKKIKSEEKYSKAIDKIQAEVDKFANDFHDDAKVNSEWGHYYFCDYDGGRLIFDIDKPKIHKCEVCGKEFESEIYDGVWVYFYRNEAILTAWKAAGVYKATGDKKYLDIIIKIIGFYAENYVNFTIHNKERNTFANYEEMKWGCGRILPQGLNEAIIAIRMIQALEIVKDELPQEFLTMIYQKMFREMFLLLKPQINDIHNIRCWMNSALGLIGLFFNDQEIIDFVFKGEYNIRKQITTGVTKDFFWYEGSIHYNFFTLEGISALLLFCEIYNYDFGKTEKQIIKEMFISAYNYAFDNQFFPNPNDGWPSINLKTYSYIYHTATKVFGYDSEVGNLLKNIENNQLPRTPLPLSKPYYIDNEIAYERLLLNTDMDLMKYEIIKPLSKNFPDSNYAILRKNKMNVFIKYGLNGPSHSHPDLINIEVIHGSDLISRDISNAGYRARLCNEWHRTSIAHNTIIRNGEDIVSTSPGETLKFSSDLLECLAKNVYEGVDYKRKIELKEDGYEDTYTLTAKESATFDYIYHLESEIKILGDLVLEDAELGFNQNGYQHITNVKRVITKGDNLEIAAVLNDKLLTINLATNNKEIFILTTLDNPVNKTRTSILVRAYGKDIVYQLSMVIKEKKMEDIKHFFINEEINGKEVAPGVTRKVISYNDNLMVCEVKFKKGSIGSMHQHPHEQCTYIVSGAFEFTIGDKKNIMRCGDSMYKEPNIIHGAVCLEEGTLIDIFTPCRKDFL